jgi:hypothetical protein
MLARQFGRVRKQLADAMAGYSDPSSLQMVVDNFQVDQDFIRDAYKEIFVKTGVDFAEFNYNQFRKSLAGAYETKDINEDIRRSVWLRQLLDYVDTDCGELIQETTRNLFAGIQSNAQKAIQLAAQEGWGAERTAREIIKLQGQMDRYKAMRIARTEVMRASNEGAMKGVEQFGIALHKVWLSTSDGRERDWHGSMNGVKVDMNDNFTVNGEPMKQPGDPDASAANTINCRCAVAFEPKESVL